MLADYSVTDISCFDDYSNAAPRTKTMRGNGITTFFLHVAQCSTFHKTIIVTATLIAKASLKLFDSRLDFNFIKDFSTSLQLKEARK